MDHPADLVFARCPDHWKVKDAILVIFLTRSKKTVISVSLSPIPLRAYMNSRVWTTQGNALLEKSATDISTTCCLLRGQVTN